MGKKIGPKDWIPVFLGGKQIDSAGVEHDGDALIDAAVSSFSAVEFQPSAVIGHPQDDSPSWGRVTAVKADLVELGDKKVKQLSVKFGELAPEFVEWVHKKFYTERSVSFYPGGKIKHIAWLGASPPAVKGLPAVAFAEGAEITFDFAEVNRWEMKTFLRNMREFLVERFSKETADSVVPDWMVEEMVVDPPGEKELIEAFSEQPTGEHLGAVNGSEIPKCKDALPCPKVNPSKEEANFEEKTEEESMGEFTQEQLDAAVLAAVEKNTTEVTSEVTEKVKAASFAEHQEKGAKAKIAAYLALKVEDGGPLPALVDMGIGNFLEGLVGESKTFDFSEGNKEKTNVDFMLELLAGVKSPISFGEFKKRDEYADKKVEVSAEDEAKAANDFIDSQAAKGTTISLAGALTEIRKENKKGGES